MQQKLSIVQIEVNTSLQTHILKKKTGPIGELFL